MSVEDLEPVCKGCHSIITYSERYGVDFNEAKIQKKAVAFSKKKANEQKEYLRGRGINPAATAIDRREQFANYARGKLNASKGIK